MERIEGRPVREPEDLPISASALRRTLRTAARSISRVLGARRAIGLVR